MHHSITAGHPDRNDGATLATWDRCPGSWLASRGQYISVLGLPDQLVEQRLHRGMLGL